MFDAALSLPVNASGSPAVFKLEIGENTRLSKTAPFGWPTEPSCVFTRRA
jgi:hypothetical protein